MFWTARITEIMKYHTYTVQNESICTLGHKNEMFSQINLNLSSRSQCQFANKRAKWLIRNYRPKCSTPNIIHSHLRHQQRMTSSTSIERHGHYNNLPVLNNCNHSLRPYYLDQSIHYCLKKNNVGVKYSRHLQR